MIGRPLVRAATAADVTAIEDVVKAAYTPYVSRIGRVPAPMAVDYQTLVTTTDDAWVLIDDDELVGVIVTVAQPDHLLIENVAISPTAQGRGYGRLLLAHAEQQACDLGLAQTRLYTNAAMTENLMYYPRLGYVEVARGFDDGFHRVFFVKDVAAAEADTTTRR
ncbi:MULTISPECIES: GNAT family N-acetyltransferase [unclassified Mycobacterium]|uniref:GNAT family N-acetyltransferase n=1 Tax=unclassified Mycobacterium TaxID=2642494 RepID=UPI0029C83CC5|nr:MULTISPECIES: GNAT family N-acetyltransferase [unclassified Mycobacterium]